MKQYIYLFALLLALSSVTAAVPSEATLVIDLLRYEPVPATPGDTITVWLQITNTGGRAAQDIVLEVEPSFPFTPASQADSRITIGTLAAQSEYVTKVRVAIDRSASQGEFELPITLRSDNSAARYEPVIEVEAGDTSIAVQSVQSTPEELIPGSRATIKVTVENVEESLVSDLTVSMDLTDSVLVPLGSSAMQKIASLDGGEQHTFTFVMLPAPDAASNVYKIPLNINFTTPSGERLGQKETIGLVIRAEPELSLIVDEAEIYENTEGNVLLRLVNKGLSEVKFVEATLLAGEGYEISGNAHTLYVGNIDSDDFETIEFEIEPTQEEFSVNVALNYRDSLNNGYTHTVPVALHTVEKPSEGPSIWIILLVVVVAIAGIVWWRRSRKHR